MPPGILQQIAHEFMLHLLRATQNHKAIYVEAHGGGGTIQGTTVRVRTGRKLSVDEMGNLSAEDFRAMRGFGFTQDELKEVVLSRVEWARTECDMSAFSGLDEYSHRVLALLAWDLAGRINRPFGATIVTADLALNEPDLYRIQAEGFSIVAASHYDIVNNQQLLAFGILFGFLDGADAWIPPSHREQIRLLKDAIERWETQMAKVQQRLAA